MITVAGARSQPECAWARCMGHINLHPVGVSRILCSAVFSTSSSLRRHHCRCMCPGLLWGMLWPDRWSYSAVVVWRPLTATADAVARRLQLTRRRRVRRNNYRRSARARLWGSWPAAASVRVRRTDILHSHTARQSAILNDDQRHISTN